MSSPDSPPEPYREDMKTVRIAQLQMMGAFHDAGKVMLEMKHTCQEHMRALTRIEAELSALRHGAYDLRDAVRHLSNVVKCPLDKDGEAAK